jgi:hypothetical protein
MDMVLSSADPGNYANKWGYSGGTMTTFTEPEVERNMRAVAHAVAQQELEGLKVSEATLEDMRRAARGEIPPDQVIGNIYARFKHVPIFRP